MLNFANKTIDEARQGEAYAGELATEATPGKRFYIESYGCQMNFSDSEIIASILQKKPSRPFEKDSLNSKKSKNRGLLC